MKSFTAIVLLSCWFASCGGGSGCGASSGPETPPVISRSCSWEFQGQSSIYQGGDSFLVFIRDAGESAWI
jgi:hypothetical protein